MTDIGQMNPPGTLHLSGTQDEVIERVTEALKSEGFGVLTRIDMDRAFAEKLGVEFRPYVILGACNPGLAHRALTGRPDIGLLLPCNVVVDQEAEGRSTVRFIDPMEMLDAPRYEGDSDLADVAREAQDRLGRVAEALSGK